MSLRDISNWISANRALLAIVISVVSAIVAVISAIFANRANKLQREAIRAQTFLDVLIYEREINFSQCMDTVRALSNLEYKDYRNFHEKKADKDKQIRQVVDFLNHLAHLIRHRYVTERHILILYTASIEACRNKLLGEGNWLESFRKDAKSPKYYLNFECLCNNLENLWLGKRVIWPDPQFQATSEMRS